MKTKTKEREYKYVNFGRNFFILALFLGVFWLSGATSASAEVLKTWITTSTTITLNSDSSLTCDGDCYPNFILATTAPALGPVGGGIIVGTYPYNSLNNAVFGNFGAGTYLGYICFQERGDSSLCTSLDERYYEFNIVVNGIDDGHLVFPDTYDINFTTPQAGHSYLSPVSFIGTYQNNNEGWNNILIYYDNLIVGGGGGTKLVSIPPNSESGNFNTSIPIDSGDYYLISRYFNSTNYTFGDWIPEENSHIFPFSVVITLTPEIIYETCDVADLFCYMRNAFTWAFTIPEGTFNQFTNLRDTLRTKAPFGYVSSVFDTINGVNNTNTATFTLESVAPINDLVFTPIRTALEWLLYFVFAFMLFKRFKDINI